MIPICPSEGQSAHKDEELSSMASYDVLERSAECLRLRSRFMVEKLLPGPKAEAHRFTLMVKRSSVRDSLLLLWREFNPVDTASFAMDKATSAEASLVSAFRGAREPYVGKA